LKPARNDARGFHWTYTLALADPAASAERAASSGMCARVAMGFTYGTTTVSPAESCRRTLPLTRSS